MGAYLSSPITAKESEDGTGGGIRYGLSSMQGWRTNMEVTFRLSLFASDLLALAGDKPWTEDCSLHTPSVVVFAQSVPDTRQLRVSCMGFGS